MERLPWITKELLSQELLGKSYEEQKKIIRRAFQENNIKFKQGIKDKKMPTAEVDKCKIESLEDGINFFLEELDTSAIEEYEFVSRIKQEIKVFQAPAADLLKALYIIESKTTRQPAYLKKMIKKSAFFLEEDSIEFTGYFCILSKEVQEKIIQLISALGETDFTKLLADSIRKNEQIGIAMNILVSNGDFFIKKIYEHRETLSQLMLEIKRNPNILTMVLKYASMMIVKEKSSLMNELKKNILDILNTYISNGLVDMEPIVSKQRKSKTMHEALICILRELNAEPKKYIPFPMEYMDELPFSLVLSLANLILDNNTLAYINLFNKKETTVSIKNLSKEEQEAMAYVKLYYKNGEIINIPENIEKFIDALRIIHMTEEEIRNILRQLNSLLKKEKIGVETEVIELEETIEQTENEIVYLKTNSGNNYAVKDLDSIPIEYYHSFLELLISIKNNKFKNRKALTDLTKMLEVKNFKTRIIFSRVGQNKYAILGMFMKKVDNDNYRRSFLINRKYQFLKQQNTLKDTPNESEITEFILQRLTPEKIELN